MQNLTHSVRIKLHNIEHYLKCVSQLKEFGIHCNVGAESVYELDLRRLTPKQWKRRGYLYIGYNRNLCVYMSRSVVRHAVPMTRKEFIKWLKTQST